MQSIETKATYVLRNGKHSSWEGPRPVEDFAHKPVEEAFDNWNDIVKHAGRKRTMSLTVFRSTRRDSLTNADIAELIEKDTIAADEAATLDTFGLYFKGPIKNESPYNISFCLWETPDAARTASRMDSHSDAAAIAGKMYERFALEQYTVRRTLLTGRVKSFEPLQKSPKHTR